MLDSIVQRFLKNSKKANSRFKWQRAEHITSEVDFHLLPLGKFLAPAFYPSNHSQIFQLRGVQVVRQGLHVVGNLTRLLAYLLKTAPNLRMIVLHPFEFYRDHCKSLINVVVKLSPDAGAFL